MMRSPGPGGFLGLGHTLRSLTMSPMNSVMQQVHRQTRGHLERGGTATPAGKDAKKVSVPLEGIVLPPDIDAADVMSAIETKLGGAGKQRQRDEPDVLERRAGGRIAVSGYHILRLGDGRYDLGKRYMQRIVNDIRARRIQRRTKALMRLR
jgi:hypothetical protein